VDCVIDTGSTIIPVEIKSGSKVILSALRGLSSFIETYNEKVSHAYVITTGRIPEKLSDKITVLPWRFI
jgi:predicted AAA+ superfamily ATPase